MIKAFVKRIISFFRSLYLSNDKNITKYYRKRGVVIGNNCRFIGCPDFGNEMYLITIGDNCVISKNVTLLNHDGGTSVLRNLNMASDIDKIKPIKIGNNVFVGRNASILQGVSVGDNVIIGYGSIVTKDLPSNGVYAGIPAKYICSIEEYYEKNKDSFKPTWKMSPKEKKEYYLQLFKGSNDGQQ